MGAVRLHRAPVVAATPAYEHELGRLLRVAQEGFYWQGEVEDLLIAIRDGGDLAQLARAGGPIISRFVAMRVELRRSATRPCATTCGRWTRSSPTTRCC